MTTTSLLATITALAVSGAAVAFLSGTTPAPTPATVPAGPLTFATVLQDQHVRVIGRLVAPEGSQLDRLPVVLLVRAMDETDGTGGDGGGAEQLLSSFGFSPLAQDQDADRRGRYRVAARAMSDDEGRFTFPRVEPGRYRIEVGDRRRTLWAVQMTNVQAGEEHDLGQIELRQPLGRDERGGEDGDRRGR